MASIVNMSRVIMRRPRLRREEQGEVEETGGRTKVEVSGEEESCERFTQSSMENNGQCNVSPVPSTYL